MKPKRLIVAVDTADQVRAAALIQAVAPHCGLIKLGLEFFTAFGPAGVAAAGDVPVFLDLKLHDIPNTVGGAVRSLLNLKVKMLTVHAGGGLEMVAAARRAADEAGADRPLILAVTVLTSLDAAALHETGVAGGPVQQVLRLGRMAMAAGADGLVCSAQEAVLLRAALGPAPVLVTPGIRPAGAAPDDQARVMTPAEAIAAGADYIVVGRPVTEANDPGRAAAEIAASLL